MPKERFKNMAASIRHWCGVARYRLIHPDAHRKYREHITEYFARLEEEFVPMRLGVYMQHEPRAPYIERFPRGHGSPGKLSIAIVTPSYNQGKFVGNTAKSVLDQNHPNVRYAVMDGGSQDESRQVIAEYAPRLSAFVSEKDAGQSDAIKKGFSMVAGDIMAYLNSDDMLMPGVLACVEEYFKNHEDVHVVYGHRIIIDENGQQIGRWVVPPHSDTDVRYFDYIPQETMFWRKRIWEKIGGVDPKFQFAMDWDLILRFIGAGAKFRRLPLFMAYFRAHGAQKSHTMSTTSGERETKEILDRVHPGGMDRREFVSVYRSYRRRAAISSVLLNLGIRI
ncbi:MAG: glycosyltransferase family 2 protein [Verrucomicrobiota bacterium]